MISGALNLYVLIFYNTVYWEQKVFAALSIFCAWIDLYTLASKRPETGMLSLTLSTARYNLMSFSVGVIIVYIAFTFFAVALYQREETFSSLGSSFTTIFAIAFGDAVRENCMAIHREPFSTVFAILTIGVFYSALSQVYIGIFILKYEKLMKSTNKDLKHKCKHQKLLQNKEEKLYVNQTNYYKVCSKKVNVFEEKASKMISSMTNLKVLQSEGNSPKKFKLKKDTKSIIIKEAGEKISKTIELNRLVPENIPSESEFLRPKNNQTKNL